MGPNERAIMEVRVFIRAEFLMNRFSLILVETYHQELGR